MALNLSAHCFGPAGLRGRACACARAHARTRAETVAENRFCEQIILCTDSVKTDAQVEYFITLADDYINARLASIYTVPFTSTPPVIKQVFHKVQMDIPNRNLICSDDQLF